MITIEIIKSLVRSNILQLKPYSSARDEFKGRAEVFLDANENPFGSPLNNDHFNRYPDPMQANLKKAISDSKNIEAENIFIGNGSDEPIDIIFRIFCEPAADEVIICPPTYGMYEVSAEINNSKVKKVFLTNDFQLDTNEILQNIHSNTKLIFICSPNNPSGNLMNRSAIEKILENFKGIVVIDEAYIDFCKDASWLPVLHNYPNLIILQTFSKAFGLAGLRTGMAFAHSEIISLMNKVKPPYNLNAFSIEKATEAIRSHKLVDEWISELNAERKMLAEEISKMPITDKVYPSDANFLLVRFKNAAKVYAVCSQNGIVLRDRSSQYHCDNCLRITIGKPNENKKLITVLKNI
jgi:histidinol-phosphate aminotransferase